MLASAIVEKKQTESDIGELSLDKEWGRASNY